MQNNTRYKKYEVPGLGTRAKKAIIYLPVIYNLFHPLPKSFYFYGLITALRYHGTTVLRYYNQQYFFDTSTSTYSTPLDMFSF